MSEPVFFKRGPGFTIAELAELVGAKVIAPAAGERRLFDVASLERAGPADISVVDETVGEDAAALTHAGVCLVSPSKSGVLPAATVALIVDDPHKAFVRIAMALYPDARRPSSLFEARGTALGAFVHSSARIEAGVTIDPAAMIGPRAEIGAGSYVGPMAVIGPEVRIGRNCSLGAGASVTNALLGDLVVIEPGCRIGVSRENRPSTASALGLGRVILQDKVVVGANSVVDRGSESDTIIGEGTMIDPLVQIPADALVGRFCRIGPDGGNDKSLHDEPDAEGLLLSSSQLARGNSAGGERISR